MSHETYNDEMQTPSDKILGIDLDELKVRGSAATAAEIAQQPRVWRETCDIVERRRADIDSWLQPVLGLPGLQVIFCGAGTSAFIGDSVADWLAASNEHGPSISFASVSTTDLVPSPARYFRHDRPTLMVSFARSGDSPESVASVELASACISKCYHLVLTCNPDGHLAKFAERELDALCILMPEGTDDEGFAMTSSYSSMLVACLSIFSPDRGQLEQAAGYAERIISEMSIEIAVVSKHSFDRVIVLGAGVLRGTAREAALKCLELASGKVMAISDTPLGFRHGPKIVVSPDTRVIFLRSGDVHTSKYDQDFLDELRSDGTTNNILELSMEKLFQNGNEHLDDIWLSLIYIVYCQIFAFMKSYALGVTVDSPCPSGEVNRVVQGVMIHPYPHKN
jgi:tagatose-6-phosphate ketose/aldose isomerase